MQQFFKFCLGEFMQICILLQTVIIMDAAGVLIFVFFVVLVSPLTLLIENFVTYGKVFISQTFLLNFSRGKIFSAYGCVCFQKVVEHCISHTKGAHGVAPNTSVLRNFPNWT